MKKIVFLVPVLAGVFNVASVQADDSTDNFFTGDTRLACEAILCLSADTHPSECTPSLERYFSINRKKMRDTLKARRSFLEQCPTASQDEKMRQLVNDVNK